MSRCLIVLLLLGYWLYLYVESFAVIHPSSLAAGRGLKERVALDSACVRMSLLQRS